jgi:two-component system sensor histidine kinase TctE
LSSVLWPSNSLHGRLLRRLALVVVLVVIVSGAATYSLAQHFSSRVFDSWLSDAANSLAIVVEGDDGNGALKLPATLEDQVRWDDTDDTAVMVYGETSGLVTGRADLPDVPGNVQAIKGTFLFDAMLDGESVRVASVRVKRRNGEAVTVTVAETRRKRKELAGDILLAALTPVLLLAVGAVVLVVAGVQRALLPLNSLSDAISRQEPQNLVPLPLADAPPEVRPLASAINDLLARLNDALNAQRGFVADTAHQLRTPLAGLKVQLEDALRQPNCPNEPLLKRLLGGVERASRLSVQLLALARAEADATQGDAPQGDFDLVALASEVGAEWVPRLLRARQDIALEAPDTAVMVHGRATLLTEAVDNLLDNARKYAGSGATIRLIVVGGAEPSLTVADDGPGFPTSLKARLFTRFARGDHTGSDGAGLGLAIVKELMHAQGGSAQKLDSERGAVVRLRLNKP